MNKETIKMIIFMVTLGLISISVAAIPENTSVVDLIKGLYVIVLMFFVYIVMKDI